MSNSNNSSGGIGLFGMLGVLFIGLKLTGYINWSWWYVTMPFWVGIVFVLALMFGGIMVVWLLDRWDD